jgi:hypothetical protein
LKLSKFQWLNELILTTVFPLLVALGILNFDEPLEGLLIGGEKGGSNRVGALIEEIMYY